MRAQRRRPLRLSRETRAAYDNAVALLRRLTAEQSLPRLEQDATARPLLDRLRQDLEVLSMAPQLRIGAARRLQGADSRRQTTALSLFEVCTEVRRRIKTHFRSPRHLPLRRAFGEGLPASPAKLGTTLILAEQILAAAESYPAELRLAHVRGATLGRIGKLRGQLRATMPEKVELRLAQKKLGQDLTQLAARVNELCVALSAFTADRSPETASCPGPVPAPAHGARNDDPGAAADERDAQAQEARGAQRRAAPGSVDPERQNGLK